MLMAFCEGKVIFLAASKKAKLLQDLSSSLPGDYPHKLEVLTREKADQDKGNFAKVVEALKVSSAPTHSSLSAPADPARHLRWACPGEQERQKDWLLAQGKACREVCGRVGRGTQGVWPRAI